MPASPRSCRSARWPTIRTTPRAGPSSREGVLQPAPAPRFSRTVPEMGMPPRPLGADTDAVLRDWGFAAEEIDDLKAPASAGPKRSADMDLSSQAQQEIRDAILKICARFGDDYWLSEGPRRRLSR